MNEAVLGEEGESVLGRTALAFQVLIHAFKVEGYPSFAAIRPYLTILQQDGFIETSSVSNMQGTVFELTAQGRKALMAAGVELV